MPTFTALTTTPGKESAGALAAALEEMDSEPYGVGVFEIEDGSGLWEIGAYFNDRPDDVQLALLAAAFGASPFRISEVPDIDWVAHVRRELAPVSAGRFLVYGSHDADKVTGDVVPLLIEASMAFGTGHHGTTKGCLVAFDKLLNEGAAFRSVADIGCGTAVLAMAAASELPDASVIAGDIDAVAVDVAVVNLAANDLSDRVDCFVAAGFGHDIVNERKPFDLIFANILKSPLIALAPDVSTHLESGGTVILSGILHEQADEVVAAYEQNGLIFKECFEFGEWSTLVLGKK